MKVKRYLNQSEREQAVALGAISETLEDWATKARELGRKEQAKWLKMASTYAFKVLRGMVQPLDEDKARIVLAEARRSKVTVQMRGLAEIAPADQKRQMVLLEDLYGLAQLVSEEACYGCRKGSSEVQECEARTVMLSLGVPVFDERAPRGQCPYKVPKLAVMSG